MEELVREDVTKAIDEVVEELLHAAGVTSPPVDTFILAQRHLGMLVCLDGRQPQRGRAQRTAGRRQIFLRPEASQERHQWTVAHEIGEHLKSDLLSRIGVEPGEMKAMTGESLANLLAYRLLVPTCWFAEDAADCNFDLLELKNIYSTASHEVIAWRFLDLPQPCIVTIIDNNRISRRRSNAWPIHRRLEQAEQKCQLQVNRTGRPFVVCENGWTVNGWPVHQTDWQREILRSAIDEDVCID